MEEKGNLDALAVWRQTAQIYTCSILTLGQHRFLKPLFGFCLAHEVFDWKIPQNFHSIHIMVY